MASQAQFRIQHVAQKPRGWRVRTKREGEHELRIGFPPGPRKRGAGKLLEILHPKTEKNPQCEFAGKNPAELVVFGNPSRRKSNHKPDCNCAICKNARGEKHSSGCGCALCTRVNPSRKARGGVRGFMSEKINFGGQMMSRARAISEMKKDGATQSQIDRWLQGSDLARRLGLSGSNNPRGKNASWMKVDGVVGKVVGTRGSAGSPEYLLETKEGKRVWVKPNYRPRRRNADETQQAVELYQTFHGKDPSGIVEKHVSAAMRLEYTALGDLEYLIVVPEESKKAVKIDFEGDHVKLAASPEGNQLYFIGGDQNLEKGNCLEKFTDDPSKDFIELGSASEVQYFAHKAAGNFQPVSYFHKFGEESGSLPTAVYDKLKKQIFLIGGEYRIEAPGIIN